MNSLVTIKKVLEQLKPKLVRKFHVHEIGLFGSVITDDFTSSSDIDIIINFAEPGGIEFIDLANYIETKLQRPVDLVSWIVAGTKK